MVWSAGDTRQNLCLDQIKRKRATFLGMHTIANG